MDHAGGVESPVLALLRRLAPGFALLMLATLLDGCTHEVIERAPSEAPTAAQFVQSEDGKLELRLTVARPKVARSEAVQVAAQLRNISQQPVTVIRPFGDWVVAQSTAMKVWNAQTRVRYTGPMPSYEIGALAFATLRPGETVEDKLELSAGNYAGLEKPDTYTLRYDYSYDGGWDTTAAAGHSGISNAWRGTISSREVQVVRE